MMTLVIYDIPEDKIRNAVAEACKDYGLLRIQWSAFMGQLNHNRRQKLETRLRRVLGRRPGNIQLYPLCEKDLGLKREITVVKAPASDDRAARRSVPERASENG